MTTVASKAPTVMSPQLVQANEICYQKLCNDLTWVAENLGQWVLLINWPSAPLAYLVQKRFKSRAGVIEFLGKLSWQLSQRIVYHCFEVGATQAITSTFMSLDK